MSDLVMERSAPQAVTGGGLRTEGLKKSFGGLHVFDGIGLELRPNQILGVIGPNGAGKTTLINVICGMLPPSGGRVMLEGQDISGKPFHMISRLGVIRSFQQTNIFAKATVEENLHRARHFSKERAGPDLDFAPLVDEFDLDRHLHEQADSMAYGKQKMLGLLMALAPKPRFLLMDEPAAGLERKERTQIDRFIAFAQAQLGCGIMIVEHDMDLVRRLCPRIMVLEAGRVLAEGPPAEVLARRDVIDAYMGSDED